MPYDKSALLSSLDPRHRARVYCVALWRWLPLASLQLAGLCGGLPLFLAGCRAAGLPAASLPWAPTLSLALLVFASCALADAYDEGFASLLLPPQRRSKFARLLSAPIALGFALAFFHMAHPFPEAVSSLRAPLDQTSCCFRLAIASIAFSAPLAYLTGLALSSFRMGRHHLPARCCRKDPCHPPSLAEAAISCDEEWLAIERRALERAAKKASARSAQRGARL